MAVWDEIKTEYITTATSYRKLSEKYGIHYKTIADKGKEEGWKELRSQHSHNTLTKILGADTEQKASQVKKLNEATDKLLEIAVAHMEGRNPMEIGAQEMKHISGVLKDVKEILMIKSPKDLEEQDARIAKLRKETEKGEQNHDVTITIEGGDPSWQS